MWERRNAKGQRPRSQRPLTTPCKWKNTGTIPGKVSLHPTRCLDFHVTRRVERFGYAYVFEIPSALREVEKSGRDRALETVNNGEIEAIDRSSCYIGRIINAAWDLWPDGGRRCSFEMNFVLYWRTQIGLRICNYTIYSGNKVEEKGRRSCEAFDINVGLCYWIFNIIQELPEGLSIFVFNPLRPEFSNLSIPQTIQKL